MRLHDPNRIKPYEIIQSLEEDLRNQIHQWCNQSSSSALSATQIHEHLGCDLRAAPIGYHHFDL
jgi:hypothetical protein